MKYVKESLLEYTDDKFFKSLFEAEIAGTDEVKTPETEDEELSPAEKQKIVAAKEKEGMFVIKHIQSNWKAFKINAGSIWQEYRDFWSTQKEADESIGQKGIFYNLYKSAYIVGVVKAPNGAAELKVYNTSQKDPDEFETFVCKNPNVVKAFNDFFKVEIEGKMKDIISAHKEAMEAKKKADKIKSKEEASAAKRAKLDAFLNEEKKD